MRKMIWLSILLGAAAPAAGAVPPGSMEEKARTQEILGQPPRIAPRTDLTEEERAFAMPPAGFGTPGVLPQMSGILLNNPALARQLMPMAGYFLREGKLIPRDRELAILRNAWLCQAPYEWGEHVAIARKVGLTGAEIEAVITGSAAAGWNSHDRAVIRAVEELHDHAMISDATWAELAGGMSKEQLLEIPALVGAYKMVAYVQNALRMELRPSNPGLSAR